MQWGTILLSMKKLLLTSCLALGMATGLFAVPHVLDVQPFNGGAAVGSIKLHLDFVAAVNQAVDAQVTISGTGDAAVVVGSSENLFAAPFISGGNGVGFGNLNGEDTTLYLSTGVGSITFDFASPQNYFGLLWGSVDDYNKLEFYDGDDLVATILGTDVWAIANGDQGAAGTFYVNIFDTTGWFDQVVASSSQYAFEIDNIAYNSFSVPDSGATVALLGLSLACLVFFRRKA